MSRLLYISLCLSFFLFLSQAKDNDFAASSTLSPPLISPPATDNYNQNQNKTPFKPRMAVIVVALTSTFSITSLIFLYVKHCKTRNNGYLNNSRGDIDPYTTCKNSGIDPNVINLLPVFRFSSLKGQIDGLECAVCLTNYEPLEVLRLLPKCKHAFHVECADTWLDSHSTCPLCRYRVDPEDILFIEHSKTIDVARRDQSQLYHDQEFVASFHRSPGRHSSAGEERSKNPNGYLQITVQKPIGSQRLLDSSEQSIKEVESASTECFVSARKDELLLARKENKLEQRIQHQIVVSSDTAEQRWSDVQPSDLLYIRSEMLMTDSRRVSALSEKNDRREGGGMKESGRRVINKRSASEITSRKRNEVQQQRQGLVSRWLAWISDTSYNTPPPSPVSQSTSASIL